MPYSYLTPTQFMRLDICSVYQKIIEDFDHHVVIGYGLPLPQYAFCASCASPIILFLQAHGLPSHGK